MNNLYKKIKIIILSIMWGIIVLGIPRIPYKTPGSLLDTDYIELDVAMGEWTGGPEVIGGKERITEYAQTMKYSKVTNNEIYLSGDNRPDRVITRGISNSGDDFRRYSKFKVYGEFLKAPDEDGVLTFDVYEWYPLDNNIYLKDTVKWENYKTIYIIASLIISLVLVIFMLWYWYNHNYNEY